MKQYKLKISELFWSDNRKAIDYIRYELGNDFAADRYVELFSSALDKLKMIAGGLQIIDNEKVANLKLRIYHVRRYVIVYTVEEDGETVQVLRLFHNSMDWINKMIGGQSES